MATSNLMTTSGAPKKPAPKPKTRDELANKLYGGGAVNHTPVTKKVVPQAGAQPTRRQVPAKATHAK